jgi:ribosomal protein L12E/L44/L45/RPP1/RPP2
LADIKLLNLKDYRYAKVDTATLEAMVEAVLTGKSFDEGKAAGAPAAPTAAPLKEAAPLQSAPKAEPAAAKVEAKAEEATAAGTGRAAEILARLRRNNAPAAA